MIPLVQMLINYQKGIILIILKISSQKEVVINMVTMKLKYLFQLNLSKNGGQFEK